MRSKKKVIVGILAQYLNTRHDVLDLINKLSENCELFIFLKLHDADIKNKLNPSIKIKWITPSNNKYWLFFIKSVYKIFGKIPKSKNNYYITEMFKISNSTLKNISRNFESLLLSISKIAPKFISYDKYLELISGKRNTLHPDIDVFFCITHIYDDKVYASMINTGKKVYTYVYSWDHPCKMKCFSKSNNVHYLVWSIGIKNDLIELHGIKNENIRIFGATQLMYLQEFEYLLKSRFDIPAKKYDVYIAMATGTISLAKQEVTLYEHIIKTLKLINSEITILIRPYPFLKQKNIYEPLIKHSNVTIENNTIDNTETSIDSKENNFEKYRSITNAHLFIHCGTTLGLETSYCNIPVFFIDFCKELELNDLNKFIHQYQNDKYLNIVEYPNVIRSLAQLQVAYKETLISETKYLDYNYEVRIVTQVQNINQIISTLQSFFQDQDIK